MIKLLLLSCAGAGLVSGLIYIERHTLEFNKEFLNWTLNYTTGHDTNSVSNMTVETFTTITKALIYFTCRVAEDNNDKEFRREVVRTVIDLGKFFKGLQGNPLLRGFIKNIKKGLETQLTFPLLPGTYKLVNVSFDNVQWPFEVKGVVNYRAVGKIQGSGKTHFFGNMEYFGGYLPG